MNTRYDTYNLNRYKEYLDSECRYLLSIGLDGVEYLGGKRRQAIRLHLQDQTTAVCANLSSSSQVIFEAKLLDHLHGQTNLVPALLGFNNKLLWQQDLRGLRLSQVINHSEEIDVEILLEKALTSLDEIHRIAEFKILGRNWDLPIIGDHPQWLFQFLNMPASVSERLNLVAPVLNYGSLSKLLQVHKPKFVKWGANPTNAMVDKQGKVAWFDWEDAGYRHRLDDMVWCLADEYVPDFPDMEERLLKQFIPVFSDDRSTDEAWAYVAVFGALHISVRLNQLLQRMSQHNQGMTDICDGDCQESYRSLLLRLSVRGMRWTQRSKETQQLSDWFSLVEKQFR